MLKVALALSAQVAAAPSISGQPAFGPIASESSVPVKDAARECTTPAAPDPNSREIVVCAVKPNGYRLDPDLLAARRLKKQGQAGRPRNPHESYAEHSCATVGPMGCRGLPTIDLLRTVTTLATMADRLSKGQELRSMFQTQPTQSEYQLYLQVKKQREEAEAEKAAKAKASAAQAVADSAQAGH